MHAHDRTLIASLGFADPDKNSPMHDLGCQYLALSQNHERLGRMLMEGSRMFPNYNGPRSAYGFDTADNSKVVPVETMGRLAFDRVGAASLETPIVKGSGQYRTIVGFLDVSLPYIAQWSETATWSTEAPPNLANGAGSAVWEPSRSTVVTFPVRVEVKSGAVHVGEVLRQIALYREFDEPPHYYRLNDRGLDIPPKWVLASRCQLSTDDLASLRSAGITHVRLGPAFEKWLAERPTDKGESPEF